MWFRRAVLRALIPAAIILPIWVLVMQGIVATSGAGRYLALLVACPILFAVMLVTALFLRARKSTRSTGALTWLDTALLVVGWLALIAAGLYPLAAIVIAVVILVVGLFWFALWELIDESRKRLRTFVDGFAVPTHASYIPPTNGETIVIEPHRS